ncbi:hypothetical protein A3C20_04055 [Candidatus Kaiserbacteria bacterium RIFCSPHIGHO2_02_FULL_55_25]|uniref:PEP-utilising enzyme mobile domain-containing protein n=1 Tax=Candidatus Kaiserbacteria bacterium RIFCSPHIGHO2_02_FULL_55_25 TaxID=1798498 RepID=A0A1F6E675_9BACT|nr:MAG: hypothetical protein A3C20_04055 [Candidatus Kaiserbacteria bacterium RIFCSPHIGHO2_02_FULL_55_25]OGG78042.1 MAG: hypothetical protein A3F56_02320 [Candidatus Kaiserbacteria bacterium RIFCSPHIGHO2_12_FULL_55_13]OGG83478.1 MAG: hypothetical protein A3A42_01180 [Candidatus Kaiserbacteria bacterium RIFCSPLOWO2_01_FULL_55_25]
MLTRGLFGKYDASVQKTFTRDFTLALVEIWARAESTKKKLWTDKVQPFLPFIVFEKKPFAVSCYMDERGVQWMKSELVESAKRDAAYVAHIEKELGDAYTHIERTYLSVETLSLAQLVPLLDDLENFWSWFEAGWWLWETMEEERRGFQLSASLLALRERTQDLVPRCERLIRVSLAALFPELGKNIIALGGDDIRSGVLPMTDELQQRMAGYYFTNGELFVGASKKDIESKFNIALEGADIPEHVSTVTGQTAFPGVVQGRVRIVYGPAQVASVENSDIIIAPMTLPDILPAMKKATAIVTDEGGVLCHAAIIARELKKPCVIGTRFATQVFKDGDMVEVNADNGIVRKL